MGAIDVAKWQRELHEALLTESSGHRVGSLQRQLTTELREARAALMEDEPFVLRCRRVFAEPWPEHGENAGGYYSRYRDLVGLLSGASQLGMLVDDGSAMRIEPVVSASVPGGAVIVRTGRGALAALGDEARAVVPLEWFAMSATERLKLVKQAAAAAAHDLGAPRTGQIPETHPNLVEDLDRSPVL